MKEKTGRKSKVLIDSIDLKILKLLTKSHEPIGVLDIADKINLTHQNLKQHLEKLIKSDLIVSIKTRYSDSPKNKIELTTISSAFFNDVVLSDMSETERLMRINNEIKPFNNFLKILDKIDNLEFEKTTLAEIISELKNNEKNN